MDEITLKIICFISIAIEGTQAYKFMSDTEVNITFAAFYLFTMAPSILYL